MKPIVCAPGVFFSNQKSKFGKILVGLAKERVGIYCHFVNLTAKWYILCPFGAFCGRLVFFPDLVCCTENNLANPVLALICRSDLLFV
jgi:hypothetical protein